MTILQHQIISSLCDPSYAITSTLPIDKKKPDRNCNLCKLLVSINKSWTLINTCFK